MAIDNRGNNVWRFRVRKDGQSFTKTFKGTEKQAQKAHDAFIVDIERGNIGLNENMRMDELCNLVYKEYVVTSCKANTQKIYKQNYNLHILPAIGNMKLSAIKTLHIQKIINAMSKTYKPATIHSCKACLGKTFSLAEKWGLIRESPFKHIEAPRIQHDTQSELLTNNEIKKLLDYYSTEKNLLHKSFFYLAIGCGLRNSEIRALTLHDIDFENCTINIDKQISLNADNEGVLKESVSSLKTTSSRRKIYAPKFVLHVLKEYIASIKYTTINGCLYWNPTTKKYVSRHRISNRFKSTCEIIGITPIRFHDLRHLQATLLIHSNVDIHAVSKRMGHSNTQTTLGIYTHSIESVDIQIADTLDTTFKNIIN